MTGCCSCARWQAPRQATRRHEFPGARLGKENPFFDQKSHNDDEADNQNVEPGPGGFAGRFDGYGNSCGEIGNVTRGDHEEAGRDVPGLRAKNVVRPLRN